MTTQKLMSFDIAGGMAKDWDSYGTMFPQQVSILPKSHHSSGMDNAGERASLNAMSFACQYCVKKKIKCDRVVPMCSSCAKAKLECVYQAPQPRRLKRKRVESLQERLDRYERTLRDNGLLSKPDETKQSEDLTTENQQGPQPSASNESKTFSVGRLVSEQGKDRYIDSTVWRFIGEEEIREGSDEDATDHVDSQVGSVPTGDLLSGAFLGVPTQLMDYHPTHSHAMKLWSTYVQNVEPLYRVLHVPTMKTVVETLSRQPSEATKSQDCLLFSIYHIAVRSMTNEDCVREFGSSQNVLISTYEDAFRQALVNASWLRTTDMRIVQAFVLYLIAVRSHIDPHTLWILTGVAVRLAQRIGLHRDGERLNLGPFDVEMRRRLFWQLLPLDGYAGQVSGTGISLPPNSWDTKQPSNVEDQDIYPGMTEQPQEHKGATEMIFCLARSELSKLYIRKGVKLNEVGATIQLKNGSELDKLIDETESAIESKYLRHCDIIDPLHLLTLGVVRAAANSARIRNQLSQIVKQTVSDHDRRTFCALASRVLDANNNIMTDPRLKGFRWSFRGFFLWDALTCLLDTLSHTKLFSEVEVNDTWTRIEGVFSTRPEMLEGKGALHIAMSKATIKAWRTSPPTNSFPEPSYITVLMSQRRASASKHSMKNGSITISESTSEPASSYITTPTTDADLLFGDVDMYLSMGNNLNFDSADWVFWE